jgi:hypothetical protein
MTPSERKECSEKIIKKKGIGINKNLPLVEDASQVKLRSLDDICKRAIAALLCTQIGIELGEGKTDQIGIFTDLIQHFGVEDCLNAKEQNVVSGKGSQQDITDVVWEYECYWSLLWALGIVDDITDANSICDCTAAIRAVSQCEDFDDFKSRCSLRSTDEILDMLDLYYRYHWAVVQNEHIDKNCPIGDLEGEVVFERRRGLEWLISDKNDWHDIELHT